MRSERSFREKSDLLMKQAVKDLELGFHEKAVSALYFSVETALSALSLKRQGSLPRGYRSRLSLMGRWFPDLVPEYDELHRIRVRADHWDDLIDRNSAFRALEIAKKLRKSILKLLEEEN